VFSTYHHVKGTVLAMVCFLFHKSDTVLPYDTCTIIKRSEQDAQDLEGVFDVRVPSIKRSEQDAQDLEGVFSFFIYGKTVAFRPFFLFPPEKKCKKIVLRTI